MRRKKEDKIPEKKNLSVWICAKGLRLEVCSAGNTLHSVGFSPDDQKWQSDFESELEKTGFRSGDFNAARIIVDTIRCALIPAGENDIDVQEILDISGIRAGQGETIIHSEAAGGIYAAIVADSQVYEYLRERLGAEVRVLHPILSIVYGTFAKPTVRVMFTDSLIHAAVFVNGLQRTESLPFSSAEEVVYYLKTIISGFPEVKKIKILVSGTDAQANRKKISEYLSDCIVENIDLCGL